MNCPKCNKAEMQMQVQIGISCPSSFESRLTKGMFRRKDVDILYANWDTASYTCNECGFHEAAYGNYVTKLRDENEKLIAQIDVLEQKNKELESKITVQNWFVERMKAEGKL